MQTSPLTTFLQNYRWTILAGQEAGKSDGQLLESFIKCSDDAAFGALVKRHGPMVLGVCRRVLRNSHDAEDAFQATFCVLMRKAGSVKPRERVGSWLHGVAYRTALKARALAAKRRAREKQMSDVPEPEAVPQAEGDDLKSLLDQEVARLPERYRLPIVLCDLEGKSIRMAMQQLAWPQGTVAGRLARARTLLARRLTQRGVAMTGGTLALVLAENACSATVPVQLTLSTVKHAINFVAGQGMFTGVMPSQVKALTKGVLKIMLLSKLKTVAALAIVTTVVGGTSVRYLQETVAAGQERIVEATPDNDRASAGPILPQQAQAEVSQKTSPVAAWVNGRPIFVDEIYDILGPQLPRDFAETAPGLRDAETQKIFDRAVNEIINCELLMQDAMRVMEKNAELLEKLKGIAAKEAQKQISVQMKREDAVTIEQYKEVLISRGTTLESVRRILERQVIAGEYLRAKIRPQIEKQVTPEVVGAYYDEHYDPATPFDEPTYMVIANKLKGKLAEEARRKLLEELRANAVIEILDGP
jgi:RNA polymerase sigma factor (sigma-70 family)